MAKKLTTSKIVADEQTYISTEAEVKDKTYALFRKLSANLDTDIKALLPKERIDLIVKLLPSVSKFLNIDSEKMEGVEDLKQTAIRNLFKIGGE